MKSNLLSCKIPIGWLAERGSGLWLLAGLVLVLSSCGPRAHIPPLASAAAGIVPAPDSVVRLARSLAPTLYLHPDETFPLERVVAVVHPSRRVIAYHVLFRDDVHGAWVPFSKPTDQEIVWVAYEASGEATRLWTYWHGTVVGTDWRGKGPTAVDVQWGKHALLPRGTIDADLPWYRRPWIYYAMSWLLPDLALGALSREGPLCFCGSFRRYERFTNPVPLSRRLDAVVIAADPDPVLSRVFGEPYSEKTPWPWVAQ